MTENIIYALFYIFEGITCYVFAENVCQRRSVTGARNYRLPVVFILGCSLSYAVSLFDLPPLNILAFIITTFLILFFCYQTKPLSAGFLTAMLAAFMIVSEMIVVLVFTSVFGTHVSAWQTDTFILTIEACLSKLLYFLFAYITARVFFKKKVTGLKTYKNIFALSLLPMTTVMILVLLYEYELRNPFDETFHSWMLIYCVLALFSNLLVFAVSDSVQRTNSENTFLQLEKQQNKSRIEYYEMLMSQYEDRSILIHDIKHHLQNMEALARSGESENVINYIDTIREDFGLTDKVRYCGNRILDVIINRYESDCKQLGISFTAEARSAPADFMNEADLTAVLDNLLGNAVESADKSEKRYVELEAKLLNDNFFTIKIINSCDQTPVFDKNGIPQSRKKEKNHGWGTKSVMKTVGKYDGRIKYSYDENKREFLCMIIIKQ